VTSYPTSAFGATADRFAPPTDASTLLTVVLDGHDTRRDVADAVGSRVVRRTAEQVAEQINDNGSLTR
jgi:hypothetical protein